MDAAANPASGSARLRAVLEGFLPESLPAGCASSVFCIGHCDAPGAELASLELTIDGEARPLTVFGTPRADVLAAGGAYRSGYWGIAEVRAGEPGTSIDVGLRGRLTGGGEVSASLGSIAVSERRPSVDSTAEATTGVGGGEGVIAVCMATYEPDPELFAAQVESLRAQTDERWICVVSDDCSGPEGVATIERTIAGDERFIVDRSPERLGFYLNFERALSLAPREASLIALCDQDDRWYPDKLAELRSAIDRVGAALAYSDQRLVLDDGTVLRESLWRGRARNHTDLTSLLIANTIVGASMLVRRDVVEMALPFPHGPGWEFHDHWLAVVALAGGEIAYVDRPLYDYVQHAGAITGNVSVAERGRGDGTRRRSPVDWVRARRGMLTRWRSIYFRTLAQLELQAATLIERCGPEMSGGKRRAALRIAAIDRRPSLLAWLLVRPVRAAWGRTETLATEWHLARGAGWRWILAARSRRGGEAIPKRPLESAIPPFDVEAFGQRRLKRWLASRD
ncbi:MAG: glycosyltransferase [Solirubrobacterales bacterium]